MPFSVTAATSTASSAPTGNEPTAFTIFILPIGVKKYDHLNVRDVSSATVNALAWVVAAMRMKCQPMAQALFVEEATAKEALLKEVEATLEIADLDKEEQWGLEEIAAGLGGGGQAFVPWPVLRPTFDELILAFRIFGEVLRMDTRCRVLVAFSGHGAISQGSPVLCPADTRLASGTDLTESPRIGTCQ